MSVPTDRTSNVKKTRQFSHFQLFNPLNSSNWLTSVEHLAANYLRGKKLGNPWIGMNIFPTV